MIINLQQTRALTNIKSEKDTLHRTVEDLQRINHGLSLEVDDSVSLMSSWTSEKEELSKKLKDSERGKYFLIYYSYIYDLFLLTLR